MRDAPALYWALDEQHGTALDSSGNSRAGSYVDRPVQYPSLAPGYLEVTWTHNGSIGSGYSYVDLSSINDYTIQDGDVLEYGVNWRSGTGTAIPRIAMDLYFTSGNVLREDRVGTNDQNNLSPHPSTDLTTYAKDKWYDRRIPLSPWAGFVVRYFAVATEADDAAGTYIGWFRNIRIVNGSAVKFVAYENNDPSITSPTPPTTAVWLTNFVTFNSITAQPATMNGGFTDKNIAIIGALPSSLFSRSFAGQISARSVDAASLTGLPVGGADRTIECWVYPRDAQGGALVSYGPAEGEGGQSFTLQVVQSGLDQKIFTDGVNAGNDIVVTGAQMLEVGKWSHVTLASSATAWEYYINGVRAAGGTFAVPINTASANSMRVGLRADLNATGVNQTPFEGRIAQVAIYPAVLTAERIAARYRHAMREAVTY